MLINELKYRERELIEREKSAFEREKKYRYELDEQKKELNQYKQTISSEQINKEKELFIEIEERNQLLRAKENKILTQQKEYEKKLKLQNEEVHKMKIILEKKIDEKEKALDIAQKTLEKEKLKYTEESRKRIKEKSNEYVNEALDLLERKERSFHFTSILWSITGAISIFLGIAILLYFGDKSINLISLKSNIGWSYLFFVTFKGLIVVGLLVALAKYSYSYSQSYMHESVKNSERRHAINFGKFYLESYGADANWEQIKEAFEHWNIVSDSAFSNQDSNSFDPKSIESAVSLISAMSKLTPFNSNKNSNNDGKNN